MKKRILYLGIAAMAMVFAFGATNYTYADDIQVNFRVQNHKAEISVRSASDRTEFVVGEEIPDVIATYKNSIRAVVKVTGPDGTILKTVDETLDLANEERTKNIDLSDIEFGIGDYKISSFGYNVDGDETVGNELIFSIRESLPEVPDTGGIVGLMQDFIKNDLSILLITVAAITILGAAVKIKKGAKR